MKTALSKVSILASKVSSNIRVIMFLLTLVLFVLAAGAPAATGSVGH